MNVFKNSQGGKYLCTYPMNGSEWGVTIIAYSFTDAEARLKAMSNGRCVGQIDVEIDAASIASPPALVVLSAVAAAVSMWLYLDGHVIPAAISAGVIGVIAHCARNKK